MCRFQRESDQHIFNSNTILFQITGLALKKSFEHMYIPQERQPFIYMSLELDPRNVDVNVHPAKHEVHFLHEDSVIDKVRSAVESKLLGCNTARNFYAQDEINNGLETLLLR
ncbi:DNA mismatch repair protein Mlh1-like isoform X4 [Periplaneta americana]|uniref:DNA mismatch repair protein Mlh1-like isoform X4 n=1 Tax=Periplaneta americana TaxID=6978 RepID=UPI0037E7A747